MWTSKIKWLVLTLFFCLTNASFANPGDLDSVRKELYGDDLFHPAPGSLIGQYLASTSAQTLVRRFPNAPLGNVLPPYQLGAEKLVVAVSPETFTEFRKYFSSRRFMYAISLINSDHIQVAYEGKSALYSPPLRDNLGFTTAGMMMVPILLDEQEGERAHTYMSLVNQMSSNWSDRGGVVLYPQNINTLWGSPFFPTTSPFWQSCASWFGNMPLGNALTDTYYFPVGDDGSHPIAQKLRTYSAPALSPENELLLHQVYSIPGHQQLGELLAPPSLRRGEFSNGGWIIYTLLGTVNTDRVPVIFLQVNDEQAPINPDFPLQIIAN